MQPIISQRPELVLRIINIIFECLFPDGIMLSRHRDALYVCAGAAMAVRRAVAVRIVSA